MDILRVWIPKNEKTEKARLFKNIDPESIVIIGNRIYFAHVGCYHPGKTDNCCCIYNEDCNYMVTNPEMIKEEMKRFDFTGHIGYYNSTGILKGE